MVATLNGRLSCFNKVCKFFQLNKNIGHTNFVLKYAVMNSLVLFFFLTIHRALLFLWPIKKQN